MNGNKSGISNNLHANKKGIQGIKNLKKKALIIIYIKFAKFL